MSDNNAGPGDLWVVIPNWSKFQHYTDRNPPWIKVYTELNRRDDWRSLSIATRGVLTSLWLEYGSARGVLLQSDCNARIGAVIRQQHWDSLSDAGFIELSASRPLALARARARMDARSRETETETETEVPLTPSPSEGGLTCNQCGEPVERGRRCTACGATPRQAGTNARDRGKPNAYTRAEAFVRNAGWQYAERDFADELDRFELNPYEVTLLEALRAQLAEARAPEPAPVDEEEALF